MYLKHIPQRMILLRRRIRDFRLRRKVSRSIMTMRPHPQQRILMSAPVRVTVHLFSPHGCGFLVVTISPTRISSVILRRLLRKIQVEWKYKRKRYKNQRMHAAKCENDRTYAADPRQGGVPRYEMPRKRAEQERWNDEPLKHSLHTAVGKWYNHWQCLCARCGK